MPFSLGSYLLGVGTIVGALAFAVGSGVLTKTAVQETTAAAPIRTERVARAEPKPVAAPQVTEAKENPAPPVEPAAAVHPEPVPPGQADSPQPEVRSETAATPSEPPKQGVPRSRAEQREAPQKKAADRKVERHKHYAERKPRSSTATRTKPRSFEWDEEPEPPEFAFRREGPRSTMLGILRPPFERWEDPDD